MVAGGKGVYQAESYFGCADAAVDVHKNSLCRPVGSPMLSRGQNWSRGRHRCATIGEYFPEDVTWPELRIAPANSTPRMLASIEPSRWLGTNGRYRLAN